LILILSLFLLCNIPLLYTRFNLLNPIVVINLIVFLFFILKFIIFEFFQLNYLFNFSYSELVNSITSLLIFLLFSYFIFSIHFFTKKKFFNLDKKFYINNISLIFQFFIILIAFILVTSLYSSFGNTLSVRRILESNGRFYFLALISFVVYLNSIHFFCLINKPIFIKYSTIRLIVVTFLFLTSLMYCFLTGFSSSFILIFLIPYLFFILLKNIKISFIYFFLPVIIFVFVMDYSYFREVGDFKFLSFQYFDFIDILHKIFNRLDYLDMYTQAYSSLVQKNEWHLAHLNTFSQFIPRSFWIDKPFNFSTLMTLQVQPEVYYSVGSTANFNMLNEFLYTFGYMGFPIGIITFSFIIIISYSYFNKSVFCPYYSIFYILVIFNFLTTGFLAGYINDLALPLVMLNLIFFKLFVRKSLTYGININEK